MKKLNLKFFTFIAILLCINSTQSLAKSRHKKPKEVKSQIAIPIEPSYFLEILTDKNNCDKAISAPCTFRDKAVDNLPYFHETKLVIFQSKILAFQKYNNKEEILKIKDLQYKFKTTNN